MLDITDYNYRYNQICSVTNIMTSSQQDKIAAGFIKRILQLEKKLKEGKTMEKVINEEEQHSVKYSINAKGKISAECKAYGSTIEEAEERATTMMKSLKARIQSNNKEESGVI